MLWKSADVSEEYIASIFSLESKAREKKTEGNGWMSKPTVAYPAWYKPVRGWEELWESEWNNKQSNDYVPPKRHTASELQDITTQKPYDHRCGNLQSTKASWSV
jgi:hypothetical protein